MFNFFTWSIRHTVIVTVLIAILPMAGIVIYSSYSSTQETFLHTEDHLIDLTERIASQERIAIQNSINLMLMLESSGMLSSDNPEKITALFDRLVQSTAFVELFLVSPQLTVIASDSNRPLRSQGKDLISRALHQRQLCIGTFLIDSSRHTPGIYSAMPIKNEQGKIESVLIAGTPLLIPTDQVVDKLHTKVRFADRYGRIINVTSDDDKQLEFTLLDASELALLRTSQADFGTYSIEMQGSEYLVIYQYLTIGESKKPYLYILLYIPKEELLDNASSLLARDLTLLAASALLTLILAWVLSTRTLLRPLKRLIGAALMFGKGKLGTRAEVNSFGGEFKSLAQSFNHMADALEARNQQLIESKKEADSGNKAKSAFLANMSHEILTPMNAIIGLSYLALQTKMSPKLYGYVSKLYASANSLLQIINDILDFSKVEAGRIKLEEIPFKMGPLFDNISDLFTPQAERKGLKLEFVLNENVPPTLTGDSLRLGQILINLVTNAIKFTSEGKITVTCSIKDFHDSYIHLVFTVEDTGIGMNPEAQAKLFKAFSQADDSTTRRFGGTGLGLVISKQLAEMMDGNILITSKQGQGTTIEVHVNLKLAEGGVQYNAELHGEFNGLPVLIVDDDELSRTTLAEMLKRLSMRPTTVDSGEKALHEIESMDLSNPYKVVLMDWKLPKMNGSETTQRIKDLNLPDPPLVIMITAYGRNEILHFAKSCGVDAFLHKPVTSSLLYNTIQDSIVKKHDVNRTAVEVFDKKKEKSFAGKNILLVEDNAINQEMVSNFLTSKKAQVAVAENGKVALEMLIATKDGDLKPYDLVLMNVHMPVPDGLEVTRQIRADSYFANLPILAMTSDSMQEEKDRCTHAGMNGHISKPIDVTTFYSTVVQWLNNEKKEVANLVPVDSTPPEPQDSPQSTTEAISISNPTLELKKMEEQKLINALPLFDISGALKRVAGNVTLYLKILSKFTREYANKDAELLEFVRLGKKGDAIMLAHSIKGLSGNLGMNALFKKAKQLELFLRLEEDPAGNEGNKLINDFSLILQQSLTQIEACLQIMIVEPETPAKPLQETRLDLKEYAALRKALYESDASAQELFQTLEPALQNLLPIARLALLRESIESFEFDGAYQLLNTLLLEHEEDSKPAGAKPE